MEEFIFGVVLGLIVGATFLGLTTSTGWKTDIVDRGLAIYCPTDGQWAWVGECK
jgi:hypothetical protein